MSFAEKIRSLVSRTGGSQAAIASAVGMDQGQMSRYMSGQQEPSAMACLLFAGLDEPQNRADWLDGKLSYQQIQLIRAAVDLPKAQGSLVDQLRGVIRTQADVDAVHALMAVIRDHEKALDVAAALDGGTANTEIITPRPRRVKP